MHFYKKGFTLIELLVAIAIFTFMTAILVVKYAGFSEGMTLTNLAYDVALTLREAQSYGINAADAKNVAGSASDFNKTYGVYFTRGNDYRFTLYADLDGDGRYGGATENIRVMNIKQGNRLEYFCAGTAAGVSSCSVVTIIDVRFTRPDPAPKIYAGTVANALTLYPYAEIRMKSLNGSYRRVVVRSSGQISVEETQFTQSR